MVEIVFLGVNKFGEEIYRWLCDRNDATVRAMITEKEQLSLVRELEPDLLLSAGFRHIVPQEILTVPDRGAVNLHPSYLPYNRGANPNVWSIVEETPAGVAIHFMTSEVDAGSIIVRRQVEKRPDDNGKTLYERQERAMVELFVEHWPSIRDGTIETTPQEEGGSFHTKADFPKLFELDLDEETTVGELLNRLRALTFPPYNNAYFEKDGERYYVELKVSHEDDVQGTEGIHWNIPEYKEDS